MTYTFKVVSICSGGEHITIDILCDGKTYKTAHLSREEIRTGNFKTWPEISPLLLAKRIKNSNLTDASTDDEIIAAIESAEVVL